MAPDGCAIQSPTMRGTGGNAMTTVQHRIFAATLLAGVAAGACAAGEAAEPWHVSNSQLGPVSAQTAFDRDTIAALLPEFRVVETEAWSEGMAYPVIEARRQAGGETDIVFDGQGERLLAVRIRSAGLVEAAADIGDQAGEAGIVSDQCYAGMEERSGDVHCLDPSVSGLSYWIGVDYAGPDGALPPRDVILSGTVYEIAWQTVSR